MRRGILTSRHANGTEATIEIAPLIDMVFILLIFYIVSTSFIHDTAVSVTRPSSRFAGPVNERYVAVALTAQGTLATEDAVAPLGETAHIAATLAQSGVNSIVIRADAEASTAMLLKAIDTCREAGAEVVLVGAVEEASR